MVQHYTNFVVICAAIFSLCDTVTRESVEREKEESPGVFIFSFEIFHSHAE